MFGGSIILMAGNVFAPLAMAEDCDQSVDPRLIGTAALSTLFLYLYAWFVLPSLSLRYIAGGTLLAATWLHAAVGATNRRVHLY